MHSHNAMTNTAYVGAYVSSNINTYIPPYTRHTQNEYARWILTLFRRSVTENKPKKQTNRAVGNVARDCWRERTVDKRCGDAHADRVGYRHAVWQ